MPLDIHERDVAPALCQRCAACCRITLPLAATTARYRRFLRQIGYTLLPPPAAGQGDCCDKTHDVKADMGDCRHLHTEARGDGRHSRCDLYGTSGYPELCAQYNCVSWAKANDTYSERNALLVRAQAALDDLRRAATR